MDILTLIALVSLLLAFVSAVVIIFDQDKNPQSMKIMSIVWSLTALWSGVLGLWGYFSFGREKKEEEMDMNSDMKMDSGMPMDMKMGGMDMGNKPFWQKIVLSTFHCGAGCTLADMIGESAGVKLLASMGLYGIEWSWTLDYILALLIGAGFQYAAIRPMLQKQSAGSVFMKALKIDFLSLTSWQVGMYAASYVLIFMIWQQPLSHDSGLFWFFMQIAMCAGFVCSFPMNWFLVKKGIKPSM